MKTEAQELQNKKVQIDREKGSKQLEVSQLEAGIRQLQSQISAQQQSRIDSDPKLQRDIDKGRSLQNLQSRFEQLEGKISAKEGEISQIENQIAEAESQNSGLQEARAEDAAQDFREASGKMLLLFTAPQVKQR